MGLRIFLRDWNDFAAETEIGNILECYRGVEVGLRIVLSEEKRDEKMDLKGVGLEIIFQSKKEKESKVKQFRRGVRSPVR